MKQKLLFKEEQAAVGTWAWYLVLLITAICIGSVALEMSQDPGPETLTGLVIAIVVTGGIIVLFIFIKLEVTIDQQSIYYRYRPFISKERKLSKDDIADVYVRKYSPIFEYGGWGYRATLGKGKAFNVSGNIGLQLVLKDGKKLLLGTRKEKALRDAIVRLKENWNSNG